MILVGKRKGADAFLGILFSLIFILNVTLPMLYRGTSAVLVFYSYGVQPGQLLNSNYLALELSQGPCSTMAVIITVPLAAAVGSAVYANKKLKS